MVCNISQAWRVAGALEESQSPYGAKWLATFEEAEGEEEARDWVAIPLRG